MNAINIGAMTSEEFAEHRRNRKLAKLRADYAAHDAAWDAHLDADVTIMCEEEFERWDRECQRFDERDDRWLEILEIAETYGVNAALLYKLSDGAIDPRKEDA
jgi:class 3 adenylate cyclase